MKRKDLVAGTTYAWETSPTGRGAPVVLVSADLHEQGTRRSGRLDNEVHPAPAYETAANSGTQYPYVVRGVLVAHESGKQALVNPAHLRATWDDWVVLQAKRDERVRDAGERRRARETEDWTTRAHLAKLVEASPWKDRINAAIGSTRIDNAVLIEILEQIDYA